MEAPRQHSFPPKIYLVGTGPGDPGLITIRGRECLSRADVVLYDCLVNPKLLHLAPPTAERIAIDPPGGDQGPTGGIRALDCLRKAIEKQGTIVYLKGGDPEIFSRTGPELDALRQAGVPFEVVPGVTAGLAAAAYAGIPVTHARASSAVALVAGKPSSSSRQGELDFAALARFPGTLVFYMALETAETWAPALMAGGLGAQTPVAVVQRVSWPDQRTVYCSLGELVEVVDRANIKEPSVVVIGQCVRLAEQSSWFTQRPLFGRRILVTRAPDQAGSLAEQLAELGAEVLFQPAIEISRPTDCRQLDEAIRRLAEYDWVVFSSVNGVEYFFQRLWEQGRDSRAFGRARLAAIGPATAQALEERHLRPDVVPSEYRAEQLAEALLQWIRKRGESTQQILLVRASRGRQVLAERLREAGMQVEQVVAYMSTDVDRLEPEVAESLRAGRIDWVTVTSSAIARSLVRLLGEHLRRTRLASISPVTSAVLCELGFPPAAEARRYTMAGLVEAIAAWEREASEGE